MKHKHIISLNVSFLLLILWSCNIPSEPKREASNSKNINPIYPSTKSNLENLKIFYSYPYIKKLDTSHISQLDSLCYYMTHSILVKTSQPDSQRLILYAAAQYFSNRASDQYIYQQRLIDSMEKYNRLFLTMTASDSNRYIFERARCINNIGWVSQNTNKLNEAYDYTMRAKSYVDPKMPSETKAEIEDQLSIIYWRLLLLDSSNACINRALAYMDTPMYKKRKRNSSSGFLTTLKMYNYIRLYVIEPRHEYIDSFYITNKTLPQKSFYKMNCVLGSSFY